MRLVGRHTNLFYWGFKSIGQDSSTRNRLDRLGKMLCTNKQSRNVSNFYFRRLFRAETTIGRSARWVWNCVSVFCCPPKNESRVTRGAPTPQNREREETVMNSGVNLRPYHWSSIAAHQQFILKKTKNFNFYLVLYLSLSHLSNCFAHTFLIRSEQTPRTNCKQYEDARIHRPASTLKAFAEEKKTF